MGNTENTQSVEVPTTDGITRWYEETPLVALADAFERQAQDYATTWQTRIDPFVRGTEQGKAIAFSDAAAQLRLVLGIDAAKAADKAQDEATERVYGATPERSTDGSQFAG